MTEHAANTGALVEGSAIQSELENVRERITGAVDDALGLIASVRDDQFDMATELNAIPHMFDLVGDSITKLNDRLEVVEALTSSVLDDYTEEDLVDLDDVDDVEPEPELEDEDDSTSIDVKVSDFINRIVDCTVGLDGPRHDFSPASFGPRSWDWPNGGKMSSGWQNMKSGIYQRAEPRGAIGFDRENPPTGDITVMIRNPMYFEYGASGWSEADRPAMLDGAYLGRADNLDGINPFETQSLGNIDWVRYETWTSWHFAADWKHGAALMHFWNGWRRKFGDDQTGELVVAEMRREGGGGNLLAGYGMDYYEGDENNNKAPGSGIQVSKELTEEWQWFGWVTPPKGLEVTHETHVVNGQRLVTGAKPEELINWLASVGVPSEVLA